MSAIRFICIIFVLVMNQIASAQYDFHMKPDIEKFAHAGGSFFFGDIGGKQENALLLLGYEDLDFSATKPTFGFGLRKNFNPYLAVRTGFSYAYLEQSDAKSYSTGRKPRNLSFRTNIFELSAMLELRVAQFNLNTRKHKSSWEYYVFGGFGGFYYNPKAKYEDHYVALRPLTTEGQGIIPDTKPYSTVDFTFPVGGGLRYGYGFGNTVYIEMGYRVTTTDYIDDVSTSYYSREELRLKRGLTSAEMSYKGNNEIYPAGRDRGNRFNKDHYLLINIGFSRPLKSRKPTRFHGK